MIRYNICGTIFVKYNCGKHLRTTGPYNKILSKMKLLKLFVPAVVGHNAAAFISQTKVVDTGKEYFEVTHETSAFIESHAFNATVVLKKNSRNFRLNREMREKICVSNLQKTNLIAKLASNHRGRFCQIYFKCRILVPKSKSRFWNWF